MHDKSVDLENHPPFQAVVEVITAWYVSILKTKGDTLYESLSRYSLD